MLNCTNTQNTQCRKCAYLQDIKTADMYCNQDLQDNAQNMETQHKTTRKFGKRLPESFATRRVDKTANTRKCNIEHKQSDGRSRLSLVPVVRSGWTESKLNPLLRVAAMTKFVEMISFRFRSNRVPSLASWSCSFELAAVLSPDYRQSICRW